MDDQSPPEQTHQEPRWWRRTQTLLLVLTALVISTVVGSVIAGYCFGWQWTGVASTTEITTATTGGEVNRTVKEVGARTLWDWLQLLFVPVVIGAATYWFRETEREIEQKRAEERAELERVRAEEQAELERTRAEERAELERQQAEKRAETERFIAEEDRQERALQTYLDRMAELLLRENLRHAPEDAEVRAVARARTLTMLRQLNPERKGAVVRFLHESKLILGDAPVIDLTEADLTKAMLVGVNLAEVNLVRAMLRDANLAGANLAGANLTRVGLSRANLAGANLSGANLTHAKLVGATLPDADLRNTDLTAAILLEASLTLAKLAGADLTDANLTDAKLSRADLTDANLIRANLSGAKLAWATLKGANLSRAIVTPEQLDTAPMRSGLIYPDGSVDQAETPAAEPVSSAGIYFSPEPSMMPDDQTVSMVRPEAEQATEP